MYKIALLDFNGIVKEIQMVEDLQDTINALMLTDDDFVDLDGIDIPTPADGYRLKYDRETKTFSEVEWVETTVEPFDNEVAMLELLSMTEYNTCLLEMQMEF